MPGQIFADINPNTTSGTDLANLLNLFKDGFASQLSGTVRPVNIQSGGLWFDTSLIGSPDFIVTLKMFDGADDIPLLSVNVSTNTVSITDSSQIFNITKVSADSVGPILKLIKKRIASSGQTQDGDILGQVQFIGTDNGGLNPVICEIRAVASDNTTPTAQGGYLVFYTSDDATGSMLEKMRLIDGRLGIGTTSPDSLLHVLSDLGARIQAAIADTANGALLTFRKRRQANNGRVDSGDMIGKIAFNSTDNTGAEITDALSIEVSAVENHTTTAHGTKADVYVRRATQTVKTLALTISDTVTVALATSFSALVTFVADLRLKSSGVTQYVTLKAAAAMSASYDFIFPIDAGTTGYYLRKSSGGTEWVAADLTREVRNEFWNANFFLRQRSTGGTTANTEKKYFADFWMTRNALGTNGVITTSFPAASFHGMTRALQLQITTAPTSAQANGCELYYIFEHVDSLQLQNTTISVAAKLKALGNVSQVGIQVRYHATLETLPNAAAASEVLVNVNTSTFVDGQALAQAISGIIPVAPTGGVIGVRFRIAAVSSGNLYDLNNGFIIERPTLNKGSTAMEFAVRGNVSEELLAARRRYNGAAVPTSATCQSNIVTTQLTVAGPLIPAMRTAPTAVGQTGLGTVVETGFGLRGQSVASTTISVATAERFYCVMDNFSGLAPNKIYQWGEFELTFDADIY